MNALVANECAASMREIKNRQGKDEVVNISIPRFIYFFSYAELAGEEGGKEGDWISEMKLAQGLSE